MSLFRGSLLISVIALGLSAPAVAQPKADAGSGPTKGAVSTDDAGSGPTKGAKPNTDTMAPALLRDQNRPEVRSQLRQRRLRRSSNPATFHPGQPGQSGALRPGNGMRQA